MIEAVQEDRETAQRIETTQRMKDLESTTSDSSQCAKRLLLSDSMRLGACIRWVVSICWNICVFNVSYVTFRDLFMLMMRNGYCVHDERAAP